MITTKPRVKKASPSEARIKELLERNTELVTANGELDAANLGLSAESFDLHQANDHLQISLQAQHRLTLEASKINHEITSVAYDALKKQAEMILKLTAERDAGHFLADELRRLLEDASSTALRWKKESQDRYDDVCSLRNELGYAKDNARFYRKWFWIIGGIFLLMPFWYYWIGNGSPF